MQVLYIITMFILISRDINWTWKILLIMYNDMLFFVLLGKRREKKEILLHFGIRNISDNNLSKYT